MTSALSFAALQKYKVVDLSRVLGGPFCTQILGDHGADVIKVEPPAGDEVRYWGPPFEREMASYFIGVNRNKRSLSLDLSVTAGREVLLRILQGADVLVENYKPGTMERWGLDYQHLQKRFPRLVYCRISGFGAQGPLGGLPGYDAILQAMCGLMSVNGEPESDGVRLGLPVVDLSCGLYATIAILMATLERQKSGLGQFIDTTLFDSALAVLHPHSANYLLSGEPQIPTGNAHPNISPYDKFSTRTCAIFLGIGNDRAFRKLCAELDCPELATDKRFLNNADRVINREALHAILAKSLADRDGNTLCHHLLSVGLAAGPVLAVDEALALDHTRFREMLLESDWYSGIASPIKFSRSRSVAVKHRPPELGEHSRQIMSQHGYANQEIDELLAAGVVISKNTRLEH